MTLTKYKLFELSFHLHCHVTLTSSLSSSNSQSQWVMFGEISRFCSCSLTASPATRR